MKEVYELIKEVAPYYKNKDPDAEHKLVYDSTSETLEPIYFFILDLMNDFGLSPEKFVDNFTSSPGSGHFAELGQRATVMQQQGSKILGDVNAVLRSVLNIVYDLKEFRIRLSSYEDLKSGNKDKKDAALMSLKQIWMDKVDMTKGNSSIKAMALGQAGFNTLIDAFLVVKNEKEVDDIDLNDRVKRILKPRIREFNIWIENSEKELKKRYEMEKAYLRSQVSSLKLYSRWAKPYLKAAYRLEMKDYEKEPALVKAFNTILLELTLFGKQEINTREEALQGNLPKEFQKLNPKRKYYSCILVDFKFRGIPRKISQQSHYVFGGRTEVNFRAYALNEDEIKKLEREIDDSDIKDVLKLIEGSTTESMEQLQDEINFFLEDKPLPEENEKTKKSGDESNPFLALMGKYENKSGEKPKEEEKESAEEIKIRKDDWIEKNQIRPLAGEKAVKIAFDLFDVYKKAHSMPSYT